MCLLRYKSSESPNCGRSLPRIRFQFATRPSHVRLVSDRTGASLLARILSFASLQLRHRKRCVWKRRRVAYPEHGTQERADVAPAVTDSDANRCGFCGQVMRSTSCCCSCVLGSEGFAALLETRNIYALHHLSRSHFSYAGRVLENDGDRGKTQIENCSLITSQAQSSSNEQ